MVFEHTNYRSYLRWMLADRIARNPSYSLRAFAKSLGIHHSTLVQVLQEKKRLSVDRAHLVAYRLELEPKEREYFCLLVEFENARRPEQREALLSRLKENFPQTGVRDLSVDYFRVISEWYHMPILEMTDMKNFDLTAEAASKRLGITRNEAKFAIQRLEELELLRKDSDGRYRKAESRFLTESTTPAEALRNFHRQMLEKAIASLTSQAPSEKWIGTETFAFDPSKLSEASDVIERFFDRMLQLSGTGENRDQVYHLSTSFFRLTSLS